MELHLRKNQAAIIKFPMLDAASPDTFLTGLSVVDTAFYKDGAGAWTSLPITFVILQISTSGMYYIEMTAGELNHDEIVIKLTAGGAANSMISIRTFAEDVDSIGVDTAAILVDSNEIQGKLPTNEIMGSSDKSDKDDDIDNIYNIVNDGSFGNAQLVRSTTPANTISIDGDGNVTASNIVSGTGNLNAPASVFNLTTGNVVSGDIDDTKAPDGNEHQIEDTAGTLDCDYTFESEANGRPSTVTIDGRVNSANDTLTLYRWNYDLGTPAWEVMGIFTGQGSSTNQVRTYALFNTNVGKGVNAGQAKIRFQATGLTGADLYIDQILISYGVVPAITGYDDGAIWYNSNGGVAGTTPEFNGIVSRPVDNIADALTLANSIGLKKIKVIGGSSMTLAVTMDNFTLDGAGHWDLSLGGQSCDNMTVVGAEITGTGTGAMHVVKGHIGDCSIEPSEFHGSAIEGTITITAPGVLVLDGCRAGGEISPSAIIDTGVAVANVFVNANAYHGDIELQNLNQVGDDSVVINGSGGIVINANCVGGNAVISGNLKITNNSGGSVTIDDSANTINQETEIAAVKTDTAAILVDTAELQSSGVKLSSQGKADVNAEVLDVVNVDTISELSQAKPSATPTLFEAIMLLYMMVRNKETQTSSEKGYHNDAGTKIVKATLSDDDTTFIKTELVSGA